MNRKSMRVLGSVGLASLLGMTVGCGDGLSLGKSGQTQGIKEDGEDTITEANVVAGNAVCAEGMASLKIDPGRAGTFENGDFGVTISDFTGSAFVWASTQAVAEVLVKGGPVTKKFTGGVAGAAHAALNLNGNGNRYGISHITFCYDADVETGGGSSSSSGGPTTCPDMPLLTDFHFEVEADGEMDVVDNLRGSVTAGGTVTAVFTVGEGCQPLELTLAAYAAPSAVFDASTAHLQVLTDFETGLFQPGQTYRIDVFVPECFFQVDFAYGPPIVTLGTDGFYGPRLISADNGGSVECSTRKVGICHRTHSDTNTWVHIEVSENAIRAHLAHGDMINVTADQCPPTTGGSSSSSGGTSSSSGGGPTLVGICTLNAAGSLWVYASVTSDLVEAALAAGAVLAVDGQCPVIPPVMVPICTLNAAGNGYVLSEVEAGEDLAAAIAAGAVLAVNGQCPMIPVMVGICTLNAAGSAYVFSSINAEDLEAALAAGAQLAVDGACPAVMVDICTLNAEGTAWVMTSINAGDVAAALAAGATLAVDGVCPVIPPPVEICTLNASGTAYVLSTVAADDLAAALAAGAQLAVEGACPLLVPICQLNADATAWLYSVVGAEDVEALLAAGAQLAVDGACPMNWNSPNKVPCAEGTVGFTLYAPGDGVYTDGTITVMISDKTSNSFKWSTDIGIDSMMVKAGLPENVWVFSTEMTSGMGTSVNLSTGQDNMISYVRFCYDVD